MRLGLQGLAGVSRWGTGVFRDKTRIAGQGAPGSPGVGLRVRTSAGSWAEGAIARGALPLAPRTPPPAAALDPA